MRCVVFCLLFLALVVCGQAANVRFIHYFFNGPTVDVAFNGKVTFSQVSYSAVTKYVEINDGEYNVTLQTGQGVALSKSIKVSGYTTVAALGSTSLSLNSYSDPFSKPDINAGQASVRFIYNSESQAAIDIYLNNNKVGTNVTTAQSTNYITVQEGIQSVVADLSGTTATFLNDTIQAAKGVVYTVLITKADDTPLLHLVPIVDSDYRTVKLRVSHASPDAPAVDVLVGGVSFNSLSFTTQSGYQDVNPPGPQTVVVSVGGKSVLNHTTIPLEAFQSYTLVIFGFVAPPANNDNKLNATVLSDPAPMNATATVRLANFVPDRSRLLISFANKTFVLDYAFFGENQTATIAPGVYPLLVSNSSSSLLRARRYLARRSLSSIEANILNTTITVTADKLYTVFVEGSGDNVKVVADNQPAPPPPSDGGDSGGLSGGAIAGIVIGTLAGTVIFVGIVIWCRKRRAYETIP
eukprot:TRINITY_DN4408_c0_g5_i1.p1 TRINITY_DN4408_c0_g5~~TRINITY_DN4408_c0_g5_i1.p1  ORF type:complete len:466 (-),score=152.41 TRINITY_DN4408_c0_g5_i1:100-1497(-)